MAHYPFREVGKEELRKKVDKEELRKLEPAFDEVEVLEEEIVFVLLRQGLTGNLFD